MLAVGMTEPESLPVVLSLPHAQVGPVSRIVRLTPAWLCNEGSGRAPSVPESACTGLPSHLSPCPTLLYSSSHSWRHTRLCDLPLFVWRRPRKRVQGFLILFSSCSPLLNWNKMFDAWSMVKRKAWAHDGARKAVYLRWAGACAGPGGRGALEAPGIPRACGTAEGSARELPPSTLARPTFPQIHPPYSGSGPRHAGRC